jgi:hypothetical protein
MEDVSEKAGFTVEIASTPSGRWAPAPDQQGGSRGRRTTAVRRGLDEMEQYRPARFVELENVSWQ